MYFDKGLIIYDDKDYKVYRTELLAPAGSYSRAKVAFMYGADAVYAGTTDLSLRTRVGIDNDEFVDIVNLAKKMDKKVYAALNIYAFDEDYQKVKESELYISNGLGTSEVTARLNNNPSINFYRFYKNIQEKEKSFSCNFLFTIF